MTEGTTVANKQLKISSVEFRDGQQSLLATRVTVDDMLPILPTMDKVGYECMEMWGGATFDSCIRYLQEDPWERVRLFKQQMKNTPLRMLLRGQNLVGYTQYPDDIVELFVERAAKAGIDIFLIFDGLNDVRNCKTAIEAVLKNGKKAEANILFTISPVHNIEAYVRIAKEYVALGVTAIHLEDMAGQVTPTLAYEAVKALKEALDVPVHFQCHCTGGMADMAYWEAIRAGADVIDCDVSAFALGTAHPAIEPFVVALRETPYDTKLDLELLGEINTYFKGLRQKYKEFESQFVGVDISVLQHQVPGGMLSNLEMQLKGLGVYERLPEVLEEVHRVRADFGYPPLGTPFSQIVGAQAATNVITGKRYAMLSSESRQYIKGMYGITPGPVAESLLTQVLGTEAPVQCRPADLIPMGLEKAREEIGALAKNEEDLLTYALFPSIGREFLQKKYGVVG